jgi:hypothetical protein
MREQADGTKSRRLLPILDDLSRQEPVIARHGPRAVGKSAVDYVERAVLLPFDEHEKIRPEWPSESPSPASGP